uniref:(northern house mosquito) hypothetical protein n=1 Tax=Culex pipiens TaxID=7175 RepID=A0A8D8FMI5_CULPI
MNFPINFPFPSRIGGKQNQKEQPVNPTNHGVVGFARKITAQENSSTNNLWQILAASVTTHKVGQIWDRSQIGSNQPTLNVSSKLNLSFPFGELILVDQNFFWEPILCRL